MNKKMIIIALGMLATSMAFAHVELEQGMSNAYYFDAESQLYFDLSQMNEYRLLEVSSDVVSFDSEIRLILDDHSNIAGLHYLETTGKELKFSRADLLQGVTLTQMSGRDVTKVKIDSSFSAQSGGLVMMSYLSNGVTNTYKPYPISLSRSGDQWVVKNSDQVQFSRLFLRAKKLMGIVVGIEEIIPQS